MGVLVKYIKYYDYIADEQNNGPFEDEDLDFFSKHNLFLFFSARGYVGPMNTDEYKKFIVTHKLLYKRRVAELCAIGKTFDSKGIPYIVFKGIGLAETYPEPFTRVMGDHDILVPDKDFEYARSVLSEMGYNNPDNNCTFKDVSLSKKNCLNIELHHALFNKNTEYYADDFEAKIWHKTDSLIVGKGSITLPEPEVHFRYIVLHMIKHLKGSGAGLRYLLDVKYFSSYHNINLFEQYDFFESIGYGLYYQYCISLCVYYLDTHISDTQNFLINKNDPVLNSFGDYIAENGVFGHAFEKHRINARFELYKQLSAKKSNLSIFKNAIFPCQADISPFYAYAKKNALLLPVAWFHRFIKMIFRKDQRAREKLFFFTRDNNVVDSITLMKKQLGIDDHNEATD